MCWRQSSLPDPHQAISLVRLPFPRCVDELVHQRQHQHLSPPTLLFLFSPYCLLLLRYRRHYLSCKEWNIGRKTNVLHYQLPLSFSCLKLSINLSISQPIIIISVFFISLALLLLLLSPLLGIERIDRPVIDYNWGSLFWTSLTPAYLFHVVSSTITISTTIIIIRPRWGWTGPQDYN